MDVNESAAEPPNERDILPDIVWVIRGHDQYENGSYTESVWTDEAAALAHLETKRFAPAYGGTSTWPYEIDKVRLNVAAGYE